jgi:hypothetical protein
VARPSTDILTDPGAKPSGRDAQALADAISRGWRPYRLRAYAAAIVAGILVGGIPTAIATTAVVLVLSLAGITIDPAVPWDELIWSIAFAVAFAAVGAWALVRWLPHEFKAATESYIWLASRAEEHWREQFGGLPVPRPPEAMRAFLTSTPATPETAHQRSGLYLALGDVEAARRETGQMPVGTAVERYQRAATSWLLDFVAGGDGTLEPVRAAAAAIDDPAERLEAEVEVALSEARVALAHSGDWLTPAAALRDRLGDDPSRLIWRLAWGPAFRGMLALAAIGVVLFWILRSIR